MSAPCRREPQMMPQPQIGRSVPCDGTLLEGALTRLANELYAAPPGGVAGGMSPLAVGAVPNAPAPMAGVPGLAAPAVYGMPSGSAAEFGAPLSPTAFGAPSGFASSTLAAPGFAPSGLSQLGFNPAGAGSSHGGANPADYASAGAMPGIAETPRLEPAANGASLGAGGGTAAPAPPFPTTAREWQILAAFTCPFRLLESTVFAALNTHC